MNYMREEATHEAEEPDSDSTTQGEDSDADQNELQRRIDFHERRVEELEEELELMKIYPEFNGMIDQILLANVPIMQQRGLFENTTRIMETLVISGRIEQTAKRMPLALEIVSRSEFY